MPALAYYVSGHGFGHAARSIEVINRVAAAMPDLRTTICSSVPAWLLDLTLTARVERREIECDTGAVQLDSLHLDEAETIRRADRFHRDLTARARTEARFLTEAAVDLVVGDIPPLACAAAEAADLPSIALGNFTWDWIYAGYPEHLAGAPDLLPAIRGAYRTASLALRLPLFGGFDVFGPVVRDLPLIARQSRCEPGDVRRWIGAPEGHPLVLVSFGGHGLASLRLETVDARGEYTLVTTTVPGGDPPADESRSAGVIYVVERDLYASGFRYEDLVAAADVVVTKPGYGILAEAAANDAAVLYTSRGRFVEYDVLVAGMPRLVRSRYIAHADLLAGRWRTHLDRLLADPRPAPAVTSGADAAARIILDHLG